jgi:hypothetical protein
VCLDANEYISYSELEIRETACFISTFNSSDSIPSGCLSIGILQLELLQAFSTILVLDLFKEPHIFLIIVGSCFSFKAPMQPKPVHYFPESWESMVACF